MSSPGGHGYDRFDKDSEEEDDEEDEDLRRSMPGIQRLQVAKAQIHTIQYDRNRSRSPRNILAADLGSSMGSKNNIVKNKNMITLGLAEQESEED